MSSDDFGVLEDADPVTSGEEDSLESEVEDHEAAAERHSSKTHGADAGTATQSVQ